MKEAHFVDGTEENRLALCRKIAEASIDVGLIGIGENGHVAFNDPPADFDTEEPYIVVNLNDTCKNQQVGEGWFATPNDVPKQAVYNTLTQPVNDRVPATIMKTHPAFTLYVDGDSAQQLLPSVDWVVD